MTRAPFVMGKADTRSRGAPDRRHHDRLALRQPADEGAVRHRRHAGDGRERRRGLQGGAQGPGRVRAPLAAARGEGAGRGLFARRSCRSIVPQKGVRSRSSRRASAPETTLEALAKLKPFVRGGHGHRGNASGVNDGAAALSSPPRRRRRARADARARIVAWPSAGVAPRVMGIGPVPATRKLVARYGLESATST